MRKTAFLVTPLAKDIPILEDVDYIGVDAGALCILDAGLPLKFAIGDFDSMDDLSCLDCPIERHPVMKDETDSELAIRLAYERGYECVILYGGLSGRLDHTFANLRLLMYRYSSLILLDDHQSVKVLESGIHYLKNEYLHVSFYPIEKSEISLHGFLYPLDHQNVDVCDIYCTSNSFVDDVGVVYVHHGRILCIESNWR